MHKTKAIESSTEHEISQKIHLKHYTKVQFYCWKSLEEIASKMINVKFCST